MLRPGTPATSLSGATRRFPSTESHAGSDDSSEPGDRCRLDVIDCLRRLVLDVRPDHPALTTLSVGSWLTRLDSFLDLFPPAFRAACRFVDAYHATYGWWGRYYLDRRVPSTTETVWLFA